MQPAAKNGPRTMQFLVERGPCKPDPLAPTNTYPYVIWVELGWRSERLLAPEFRCGGRLLLVSHERHMENQLRSEYYVGKPRAVVCEHRGHLIE